MDYKVRDGELEYEEESHLSYLYLHAAFTKKRVSDIIKNKCIEDEYANRSQIFQEWSNATESLRKIEKEDEGAADNCEISDINSGLIEAIKLNPAIKNNFSAHVHDFSMVEIDNIIATQREVLLDYVDQLSKKIPKNPSEDDLLKFCLIPEKQVHKPKPTRKSSNSWYFSSPSHDFRFLGGYLKKELTKEDIESTNVGGFPTHAITLFVGYGAGCMSATSVSGRVILTNGFHRAYALRKKGIKKIPLLLKKIGNADLDFPADIHGLKKDYLLKHPRPIMIKDFFNDELVRVLKRKQTTTVLNVRWDSDKVSIDL